MGAHPQVKTRTVGCGNGAPRCIGAHVSASGGIDRAVERVAALGGTALQVFSASPRVWRKPDLESIDTQRFFERKTALSVSAVFTHALYLINLASDKPDQLQKSIDSLKYELAFDARIKGSGVVVHLGSHQGRGWEASKHHILEAIGQILLDTPAESTFLIENSAGQNGKIGSNLEEISWLLAELSSERVGWCLDTCHAFAAGYFLGEQSPSLTAVSLSAEITRLSLWNQLTCIHVNDSRDPFDSGRDRHANLGEGSIPQADFVSFLSLKEVTSLPLILEVPGSGDGPDKANVDRLKLWLNSSSPE